MLLEYKSEDAFVSSEKKLLDSSLFDSFDSLSQEFHSITCGCDSCKLSPVNNFDANGYRSGSVAGGKFLETGALISDVFVAHTANALRSSGGETLEYYIHGETGFTEFDDYAYGYSLGHSSEEEYFIRSIFDRIDQYIDLDFRESSDWFGSVFDIYCLESYSEWSPEIVGQANSQGYGSSSYWDIYWLSTGASGLLSTFDKNTIVHEIGHALGLSHPYEDPKSTAWNTDDTVMSYNVGPDGWNDWFTANDIAALVEVWGVENDNTDHYLRTDFVRTDTWWSPVRINREVNNASGDLLQAAQVEKGEHQTGFVGSIVNGDDSSNIVRGLAGFDLLTGAGGDDLIHGGNGRDIIDGGSGSDELHGDFGWNTYKDQEDGLKDLIAIKSDEYLVNWWDGKAGNNPNGEKADFIEGLDDFDQIKIVGVSTQELNFRENVTARGVSGIGIYANEALEAVYTGGNLSLGQITEMTSGDTEMKWSYWGDSSAAPDLLA